MHLHSGSSEGARPVPSGRRVPLNCMVAPLPRVAGDDTFAGGYVHAQKFRRAVRWWNTGLGRRPHDLRHTAASLWIAAGVDIKTVSAWLGHSTAKLTLDTYGHLMGTDADGIITDYPNHVRDIMAERGMRLPKAYAAP